MAEDINKETQEGLEETESKTYTQDEVVKLLQSEADKRVTAALEKQKKKYEKQLSLSGLDEAQRTQAEKDMRIQELEERLKEFNTLQTKNEVVKVLTARNLNPAFADIIAIGEDIEEAQAKIETLDKLFKNAVATEVARRLKGTAPKSGITLPKEITKEDFRKMGYAERAELMKTNQELYNQLRG